MDELTKEYFERWARYRGYDTSKHKTGFYYCRSTQMLKEAFELGLQKPNNKV